VELGLRSGSLSLEGPRKGECLTTWWSILLLIPSPLFSPTSEFFRRAEILFICCGTAAAFAHKIGIAHELLVVLHIRVQIACVMQETQVLFVSLVGHFDLCHPFPPPFLGAISNKLIIAFRKLTNARSQHDLAATYEIIGVKILDT